MKERPILFSSPMVNAILRGGKTQTRRLVKYRGNPSWPADPAKGDLANPASGRLVYRDGGAWDDSPTVSDPIAVCRYGVPGDRLWVKETAEHIESCGYNVPDAEHTLNYCADNARRKFKRPDMGPYGFLRKAPSIHMPRWASRITLAVTGVRVRKLQDITEFDALAEGIQCFEKTAGQSVYRWYGIGKGIAANPISAFATLWEQINGRGSWEANPWVWVVEFKRIKP